MNEAKRGIIITVTLIIVGFSAFAIDSRECFAGVDPVAEEVLENAWSNMNLDTINFAKAGVSEQEMRETLSRVCAEFSADPQKTRLLVEEIHNYSEFSDLYMSSPESVRNKVDVLLPKVLNNIFMGKESVTWGIPFSDKAMGLVTYLTNKKKMDAFRKLRYNERVMRRFAASIYKSMDTNEPQLEKSLETFFVTIANKKKYKIRKKDR